MNIHRSAYLSILLLLLFTGCTNKYADIIMLKRFFRSEIILPDNVINVQNDRATISHLPDSGLLYVMYYSSDECLSCVLNNLDVHNDIFELCDSIGIVTPIFLVSVEADNVRNAVKNISEKNLSVPIYVYDESIGKETINIPQDVRLHQFLLSNEHRPIFVGDPCSGTKLKDLFIEIITSYQQKQFRK